MRRFLEPVYLNEKMVLNCAAYLWKGVSLRSHVTESSKSDIRGEAKAGLPFLHRFLNPVSLEAGAGREASTESRSERRYTLGGLHMSVLEELQDKQMLQVITPDSISSLDLDAVSYVDLSAVLRPIDFYSLIDTVKTIAPLAFQVLRDFGGKFSKAGKHGPPHPLLQELVHSADKYEKSLTSLVDRLEADYQTSKQLEMVLWSSGSGGAPIGVVDLDVTDSVLAETRSKLTGGQFHVIGKVVRRVNVGESLSLMQRTSLSSLVEFMHKFASLPENPESLMKYNNGIAIARSLLEKFCVLGVPGPALRLVGMSVCI